MNVVELGPKFWKKLATQYKAKTPFFPEDVFASESYDAPRTIKMQVKDANPNFRIGIRPQLSMKKNVA